MTTPTGHYLRLAIPERKLVSHGLANYATMVLLVRLIAVEAVRVSRVPMSSLRRQQSGKCLLTKLAILLVPYMIVIRAPVRIPMWLILVNVVLQHHRLVMPMLST